MTDQPANSSPRRGRQYLPAACAVWRLRLLYIRCLATRPHSPRFPILDLIMSTATKDESSTSADPYFQSLFADRIGGAGYGKGTEIYKFEKIKRAKRQALAEHPDRALLDFGIGENDSMADQSVRDVMAAEINRPENRGYADNGVIEYKEAAARFMQRHFGVSLDPVTQINHCIGSKPAYAMLPACFINPGRRDIDDGARLSGRRYAHTLLRWRSL